MGIRITKYLKLFYHIISYHKCICIYLCMYVCYIYINDLFTAVPCVWCELMVSLPHMCSAIPRAQLRWLLFVDPVICCHIDCNGWAATDCYITNSNDQHLLSHSRHRMAATQSCHIPRAITLLPCHCHCCEGKFKMIVNQAASNKFNFRSLLLHKQLAWKPFMSIAAIMG